VIVVGYVHTSEYEDRDGNRRSSLEMRATAVGPDLARSIASIDRPRNTGADSASAAESDNSEDDGSGQDADSVEPDEIVGGRVMPVPA
jgi:single-strand DNA-binding protein